MTAPAAARALALVTSWHHQQDTLEVLLHGGTDVHDYAEYYALILGLLNVSELLLQTLEGTSEQPAEHWLQLIGQTLALLEETPR